MSRSRAADWLKQAHQEIVANTRLRFGVWLALAVILFYLVLVLSDLRVQYETEARRLAEQAVRTDAVLTAADWQERAAESNALRLAIEARFWRADSRGIARAKLENWLRDRARDAGMQQLQIDIEPAMQLGGYPHLWRVGAQVQSRHHGGAIRRWLAELAAEEQLIQIERLEVADHSRTRTWVYAFFIIGSDGGEGSGA